MPTYEYLCNKCGHQFEQFQSIKDAPLTTCPENLCHLKKWGKGRVKRMIGAGAGLLFKGSGFYITDYRSESYREAAKKESSAAKPAGEGKGDKASAAGTGEKAASTKKEAAPAKTSKAKE